MHRGYVKLWRKSKDSGLIKDHKTWALWTHLLLSASFKESTAILNGQQIRLAPGQIIAGRDSLALACGMSVQNVRTCCAKLERFGNITISPTNRFSVITIVNWGAYQSESGAINQQTNQQLTSDQPATNQQLTTSKECLEGEEREEGNRNGDPLSSSPPGICPDLEYKQFLDSYPPSKAKVKVHESWKAWNELGAERPSLSILLGALKNHMDSEQWSNPKYIPSPATWLANRRWMDELEPEGSGDGNSMSEVMKLVEKRKKQREALSL